MPRLATFTVAVLALLSAPLRGRDDTSGYTVLIVHPTISSTYDIHPQIQILPAEPQPRVIPPHEMRPSHGREPRSPQPEPERSGGFQGVDQSVTPWLPPDPTLAVGPDHVLLP
ncbi:MAG: hypothetical protein AB1486_15645 [Planctomycetota bacterium]